MRLSDLTKTIIFRGLTAQEVEKVLQCLQTERRRFSKGQRIYRVGDIVPSMGIVIQGSVLIESDSFWGSTVVLENVMPGQAFAEAYACASEPLMVNVTAAKDAEVLFVHVGRAMEPCACSCPCHGKLLRNMLALSAQKNLNLSRKIFYTSSKSIRGRVLSYLSDQAIQKGTPSFDIPFNRQQLADYLNVDRSALSNELGRMQRDGLLDIDRNHVTLREVKQKTDAPL